MKRPFVPVLAVIAASLVIAGCSQAAPEPTAAPVAPAPAATNAPAAPTAATKAPAPAPTKAPAAAPTQAPAAKINYPQRPITAIVPFAAGGATDISARVVLPAMEKELGGAIQIVNKGGGGSQVGNTEVATAQPDGYTIAYMALPTIITSYLDPERQAAYTRASFAPIGRPTADSIVVVVKADSPYKTMKDMVDDAKAHPEQVKAAVSGPLSVNHLPMLMIEKQTGAKFAAVHFEGSRPGVTAMLGGHVDTAFALVSEIAGLYKSGEVRVLGVMDSEPTDFLPGAPTLASQGYDISMLSSHGIAAPAGTPKEIIDMWSTSLKKVLEQPDIVKRLNEAGQKPRYLSAEEFAKFWAQQEEDIKPLMEMAKQQQS